jgi:ArsR family transcriptional regulator
MLADAALALSLRALAHPRRVRLFRLLVQSPRTGQTFSQLQAITRISDGPLVHHLREMERAGLLRRRRRGQEVAYMVTPAAFRDALRDAYGLCRAVDPVR